MWVKIISALLPIALRLITYYLDKKDSDKRQKILFYEFLKAFQENSDNPGKLSRKVDDLFKRLEEKEKTKKG